MYSGKLVELSNIECPLLTVVASRDTICPPPAATALNEKVGSSDKEVLTIPGGHVGAVVGSKAPAKLYPAVADWLKARFPHAPAPVAAAAPAEQPEAEEAKPATRSRSRSTRSRSTKKTD